MDDGRAPDQHVNDTGGGSEPPVVRYQAPGRESSGLRRAIVPVVIVAAALVLMLASRQQSTSSAPAPTVTVTKTVYASSPPATGTPASPGAPPAAGTTADKALPLDGLVRRIDGEPGTLGQVNAPVVLVAFSDYQCPYCSVWVAQTQPILRRYIDDGSLRIEWRDANIFGDASRTASKAAYAAGAQGKFWHMHDALFPNGGRLSKGDLTEEALIAKAASLGLDRDRFAADLRSPAVAAAIAHNETEAAQLGVTSTPQFFLAGQRIVGAQPPDVFDALVAKAVAAAH